METTTAHQSIAMLRKLCEDPKFRSFTKADKLTIIAAVLHSLGLESFKQLDNLTWPDGQAILLSSCRQNIERTNRTAQIKAIPKSAYFIDTGHDNAAMKRLVEMMMRQLGYELGIINQLKALFEVKERFDFHFR